MANSNLNAAKKAQNDEFYTQLDDIERELVHYRPHFKGKTVLCNCDDPRESNFFKHFAMAFEVLGLKRLLAICYKAPGEPAVWAEYLGDKNGNNMPDFDEIIVRPLKGDGDFRNAESIELLKQADIVCTNPPFSLFREYVAQLVAYDKQFLIIGNKNAITHKEFFPLIRDGKVWLGNTPMGADMLFGVTPTDAEALVATKKEGSTYKVVDGVVMGRAAACWYTNLDYPRRHEDLILFRKYTPEAYPKYDNYDAINVDKVRDIPCDYYGVMGVPITFLGAYNPTQFEILRISAYSAVENHGCGALFARGKKVYARILIKRRATT